jgi:hypothetical protein
MDKFKSFLLQYINEFEDYLIHTDILVVIVVDKDLKISTYNKCFSSLISSENYAAGNSIHSFLLPESHGILPLSDSTHDLSICLNFKSPDSSPVPLQCHIFKIDGGNKYLILGGHLMLTNEEILQKMTIMSSEMANLTRDLHRKIKELKEAHSKIKILRGIVPICMHCNEIRDDKGYWNQLEKYITEHSDAQLSHGICEKCLERYYPDLDL